jgi:hypothetical protein
MLPEARCASIEPTLTIVAFSPEAASAGIAARQP